MLKCVVCQVQFNDHERANNTPCAPGSQGHALQEVIDGSWNDDTKERADFYAPSPAELKEWARVAREKFGWDPDS